MFDKVQSLIELIAIKYVVQDDNKFVHGKRGATIGGD